MKNHSIARRYAQALYEEAASKDRVAQVDEDVLLIRQSLDGSRELVSFFESPVINRDKKEAIVRELFGERIQPLTLDFLRLLIEKGREDFFPEIVEAYQGLRDEQQGVVQVHARTAHPLGDEEKKALGQALVKRTGRKVRLTLSQDPSLIGGIIVRVGDTVYDGSVRNKLVNLREQLEKGSFASNGV